MFDYNLIWQVFVIGFIILIGAIALNIIANFLNISTWYTFIINIGQLGLLESIKKEGFNLIWLFIIYPFMLGLIGYYSSKLF
ncbi:hypothetical protein KY334_07570 [Candidatus Woesearchaeota archaeon]|nr:hypothetical protein [Candidatus Woesearchaeota archaeon]